MRALNDDHDDTPASRSHPSTEQVKAAESALRVLARRYLVPAVLVVCGAVGGGGAVGLTATAEEPVPAPEPAPESKATTAAEGPAEVSAPARPLESTALETVACAGPVLACDVDECTVATERYSRSIGEIRRAMDILVKVGQRCDASAPLVSAPPLVSPPLQPERTDTP